MPAHAFSREQAQQFFDNWEAYIEQAGEGGSMTDYANFHGIPRTNVQHHFARTEDHGFKLTRTRLMHQRSKDQLADLDGMKIRGVSSYYDKEGKIAGQWVKTQVDHKRREELLMQALQSMGKRFQGKSTPVKAPRRVLADLLTVYPMGDPHIGMYSYAKETGADFDCAIAERNLVAAVDRLVDASPPSKTAIILSLGDFFHADSSDNKSLNSGHSYDVDTRWSKVLEVGIQTMRRCIERAMEKHQRVIVRCMSGNHDDHTSKMLSVCLSLFYENNPRVEVDTSPAYFWFHRFGKVLIGSTHGDTAKPDALPAIMADEVPEDWGQTAFRYWYTGHIHTRNVVEYRGCVWESFRTLASRDAWHSKMGYRAGRDMYCIIHHKDEGELDRHRVGVEMLKQADAKAA